jgi:MFS family permease
MVTFILFLVEFVRGAYLASFLPVYTMEGLGLTLTVAGTAVTAHYITDTSIKTFLGYLLDRFSARLIIFVGLMISFAGLLLTIFGTQPWMIIVSSALFGIGVSPIWIVSLSKVKGKDRAAQMGTIYTMWLIGLGGGPVVINFFLDISLTLSYSLLGSLWLGTILCAFWVPNEKISSLPLPPLKKQWRSLVERLKDMKVLLPGMILQTTAAGMLVPILPSFATKSLGLTYSQYSFILILGGASAVLGLIPMGKFSDRGGKKWFLVIGFALFAICLASLTVSSNFYTTMANAILLGVSYAAVLPVWNAILSYQVPAGQEGLGWGIFSSVEGIGIMIGPMVGGWIASLYSENVTVWISAILLGGIALFYLLLPFQRVIGKGGT